MKMEQTGWDRSTQYYIFYVNKKKTKKTLPNYSENYVINVIRAF